MVSYAGLATFLFGRLIDRYADQLTLLREIYAQADMTMTFRSYVAATLFTCLLVWVASTVAIVMPGVTGLIPITPFMLIIISLLVPPLLAIVTFTALIYYPVRRAAHRRSSIEVNLPFALTHMGSIAAAGVPPYVIFRLISEFKEYEEVAKEMEKIVRNIEMFGLDPLTAAREVAKRTPSEEFRAMLHGFVTTTEAGGDVKHYLKVAGDRALFEWRLKRERFIRQLSAYAEFYTGIMIAAPLFIIALFAIMNMIQPTIAGFDILFLTKVSIYGLIPAINVGFLAFLRGFEVRI
jgi:flagellar protein FlaJ